MSTTVQNATVKPGHGMLARYAPLALFAVLWLDLIRQLSYQWETNEQYAYGWFVPIFAAALLWRRWQDRPGPEIRSQRSEVSGSVSSSSSSEPTSGLRPLTSGRGNLALFILIIILAAALLPLRVIHEINQDWPLITWPYAITVVLLTLYAVHLAGPKSEVRSQKSEVRAQETKTSASPLPPLSPVETSESQVSESSPSLTSLPSVKSPEAQVSGFRFHPSSLLSPWVKHFFFPICFILVAVTWPYRIEHGLTQNLMQIVASLTVEILGWIDIPAVQHGNLIEISNGTLGVDEACSGIRSFQSTLMAGLLMGELYRLRMLPRAALVGIGLTLAFCFNVARTFILSYQAEKEGMSAIDKWHDPAGFTIAIATFLCLWAIAVVVAKRWSVKGPQSPVPSPQSSCSEVPLTSDLGPLTPSPDAPPTSDLCPLTSGRTRRVRFYLAAVGVWALLTIAATEAWYRSHHLNRSQTAQWWTSYPTNLPSFQPVKVPKASAKLLKHDVENGGNWTEPDGTKWSVFCFRWKEGDPAARMSAQGHRPEYCLVGSGHEMLAMSDTRYLSANGLNFPFRFYTFGTADRPMHVFFCLWEDGAETQAGFGKTKTGDRLRTVLAGRRGMGQQTLEIICTGYTDMEAAEKAVRDRLPRLIRVENHKASLTASDAR